MCLGKLHFAFAEIQHGKINTDILTPLCLFLVCPFNLYPHLPCFCLHFYTHTICFYLPFPFYIYTHRAFWVYFGFLHTPAAFCTCIFWGFWDRDSGTSPLPSVSAPPPLVHSFPSQHATVTCPLRPQRTSLLLPPTHVSLPPISLQFLYSVMMCSDHHPSPSIFLCHCLPNVRQTGPGTPCQRQ